MSSVWSAKLGQEKPECVANWGNRVAFRFVACCGELYPIETGWQEKNNTHVKKRIVRYNPFGLFSSLSDRFGLYLLAKRANEFNI